MPCGQASHSVPWNLASKGSTIKPLLFSKSSWNLTQTVAPKVVVFNSNRSTGRLFFTFLAPFYQAASSSKIILSESPRTIPEAMGATSFCRNAMESSEGFVAGPEAKAERRSSIDTAWFLELFRLNIPKHFCDNVIYFVHTLFSSIDLQKRSKEYIVSNQPFKIRKPESYMYYRTTGTNHLFLLTIAPHSSQKVLVTPQCWSLDLWSLSSVNGSQLSNQRAQQPTN